MSQLLIKSIAYYADLTKHYQNLSHLPGFALLESSDKTWGRYDIVTAYPYERFKIDRDESNLTQTLQAFQNKLKNIPSHCHLPFQGGAIGYISYDLAERIESLDCNPHPLLSNMPLMDMGFYDWAIIVDHAHKQSFLIWSDERDETNTIINEVQILWDKVDIVSSSFKLKDSFNPLISRAKYEESFHRIKTYLQEGRSYQVNFTQPFLGHFTGDAWQIYRQVKRQNPVPFTSFLRLDETEVLSFSPERFMKMEQGSLLASPIKGTSKRNKDLEIDQQLQYALLNSEKNRAENIMIVDLMRHDLAKIAQPGSVKVQSLCALQSYHSVHHLVSDIRAVPLDNISPWSIFLSCFPGGSITGAPKKESMRIINEEEVYSRGIYCGCVGYFSNHGDFDMNIAIRTITAKDNHLVLASGGGIVIDSNCDDEYLECYTKIAAITNALIKK